MKSQSSLPNPATQAFRDCYYRIRCKSSAERLWTRHLSAEDRQRLDNDLETAYRGRGTAGMWAFLRGISIDRALLDVGYRLNFLAQADFHWLLREIGECDNPEEAVAAAIAAGHLVLVESPRAAYWDRQAINIDWHRYNSGWDFLWELSRLAKTGRPIDPWAFGYNQAEAIVAKRKHRLTALPEFPISLADLIVPAGRRTQKLNLPREQIRLFELSENGLLEEWRP